MKIKALKEILKRQKIDYFLLPNSNEFFSEYLPENQKRIQYLTGFSGSNAYVIFGLEKSYFFTDGRYTLQAKNEIDLSEFEIINIADKSVISWLKANLEKNQKLALDAKLSSVNFVKMLGSENLILLDGNPADEIWKDRALLNNPKVFSCDEKLSGLSSAEKRQQVLRGLEADAMIITKPENLCWLLNIRGSDVEFSPLLLAYGILFKSGEVELFADRGFDEMDPVMRRGDTGAENGSGAENGNGALLSPRRMTGFMLQRSVSKIQIDASATNYWLYQLLQKNNFEIIQKTDPIEILKAVKNKVEIAGAIKAHEADGLALTKFLFWLENSQRNNEEIDEIKAEEKLLEFRKENPNFLYPSFASISSFASNGAIIHYRSSAKTNKKFSRNGPRHEDGVTVSGSLYLIDSGGQYFGDYMATTDVTRTVAIGEPTAEMIEDFTRVLKGHIALARAKFPRGTSGAQLDSLARFHLWQVGKDYDHGTGHGVGSFLSVHEGPCGISKRAHQELLEGMILSNEPGFYVAGKYGIRIENLMLVEKYNEKFLQFKTLTLAPIDPRLIDFKMMTRPERKWLCKYHEEIFNKFSENLDVKNRDWLEKILTIFKEKYVYRV